MATAALFVMLAVSIAAVASVLTRDRSEAGSVESTCTPEILDLSDDGVTAPVNVYDCRQGSSRPTGALIHLHGDGAGEFTNDTSTTLSSLAAAAAGHDLLFVAPRTPDGDSSTWWRRLSPNLSWLRALVDDEVRPRLAEGSRLWWSGYSGGAEMLSYGVLHRAPDLVTGGALMMGGGGAPGSSVPSAEPAPPAPAPLT